MVPYSSSNVPICPKLFVHIVGGVTSATAINDEDLDETEELIRKMKKEIENLALIKDIQGDCINWYKNICKYITLNCTILTYMDL